jgi:hypothetical protein
MQIPDTIEVVHGFRFWLIERTPEGLRLQSVVWNDIWEPNQITKARCSAYEHRVADKKCRCGIYAFMDAGQVDFHYKPGLLHVGGEVALWGQVSEHKVGWRGEYAYPVRLWTYKNENKEVQNLVFEIAEIYGVPCEVRDGNIFSEYPFVSEMLVFMLAPWILALLMLFVVAQFTIISPLVLVLALFGLAFFWRSMWQAWYHKRIRRGQK